MFSNSLSNNLKRGGFSMPDITALAASTDLATVGSVVTQVITWTTTMLTTIASEPLLLLGIAMFIVGGVIGLSRRLIRGR